MAFSVVVMPGIIKLKPREYLRAFKEMDAIIQRGHPLFMAVWLGSVLSLCAATFFSFDEWTGYKPLILLLATLVYILGVQAPTFLKNIPVNNRIQQTELDLTSEEELQPLKEALSMQWMFWNTIRTVVSILVSVTLLLTLLEL